MKIRNSKRLLIGAWRISIGLHKTLVLIERVYEYEIVIIKKIIIIIQTIAIENLP